MYNIGEFKEFEKIGRGRLTFQNGDIYKGYFVKGKPHGYGQYSWAHGDFYKGNF